MVRRNTIILNTMARALNAGGCVLVTAFDGGAAAFNCTMSALSPGEKSKLATRIKAFEKKIQELSAGVARETAKYADPAAALASESVTSTINSIRELNTEITRMKLRIAELDSSKGGGKSQEKSTGVSSFFTGIMPGEKGSLQRKIADNEKKLQVLYGDFAKEAAKQSDPGTAAASASVAGIVTKINELKAENEGLKIKISELGKPQAPKPKTPAAPTEKKVQPESSGVGKFFLQAISNTVAGYLPGEKTNIERSLTDLEKKIQGLYVDVAKESAKFTDPAAALTAEPVIAMLAKINGLKAEVTVLNQRKAELSGFKKAPEKPKAAVAAAKAVPTTAQQREEPEISADAVVPTDTAADATANTDEVTTDDVNIVEPSEVTVEVTDETKNCSDIPLPVNGVMPDDNEYARDRIKQSTIPVPDLQPPTKEDINATVRELQSTDLPKADDGEVVTGEAAAETEIVEDVAAEAVAPTVTQEILFPSKAEAEENATETVEAGEMVETEETSVARETIEAEQTALTEESVEAEATTADPVDATVEQAEEAPAVEAAPEAFTPEENPGEPEAVEAPAIEQYSEVSTADSELEPPPTIPEDGTEGAEADITDTSAELPDATEEGLQAEAGEVAGVPPQEDVQAPVETGSEVVSEEPFEETVPPATGQMAVEEDAAPAEESAPEASASDEEQTVAVDVPAASSPARFSYGSAVAAPRDSFAVDNSAPVFRTRVYRNEFSILSAVPVTVSDDDKTDLSANRTKTYLNPVAPSTTPEAEESGPISDIQDKETPDGIVQETFDSTEETAGGDAVDTSGVEEPAADSEQTDTEGSVSTKREYGRKKSAFSKESTPSPFDKKRR